MSVGIGAGLPVRHRTSTQAASVVRRSAVLRAPRALAAPAPQRLAVAASASKNDVSFEGQDALTQTLAASMVATLACAPSAAAVEEVANVAALDGRFGILLLVLGPALGWVGFNILGPALNQLDSMNKKSVAAGAGLSLAALLAAENADAATQVADLAAADGRFGILVLVLGPALGWVAFNILGPAKNQLDSMSKSVVAGAGVSLAALLAAENADAATQVADLAAVDGRFGILLLILGPAVGWVLFNIFGPAKNQLDNMSKKSVAAGAGLSLSALLAAENADAATQVADLAAVDGRFGILLLILGPAVGWVLFNILGPALNQFNNMKK